LLTNNAKKRRIQLTSSYFDKAIINEKLSRSDSKFILIDWFSFIMTKKHFFLPTRFCPSVKF